MDLSLTLSPSAVAEIDNAAASLKLITSVVSDAAARAADAAVKPAKTLVKIVHDQRMALTRRIDAAKKACMAREDEICADLNAEISRVSKLCASYLNAKAAAAEAERRAELERIAAQQAQLDRIAASESALTGETVVAPTLEIPSAPDAKPVEGVSSRSVWTFEIVDAAAVPRAYCIPDAALIRAYMTEAKKNGAEISSLSMPGVVFRRELKI